MKMVIAVGGLSWAVEVLMDPLSGKKLCVKLSISCTIDRELRPLFVEVE